MDSRARDWTILGVVVIVLAFVLPWALKRFGKDLLAGLDSALPSGEKLAESVASIVKAGPSGLRDVFTRQQNESAYLTDAQMRELAAERLRAKEGKT